MTKLKRGRLWYVACKTPIPLPPPEWDRVKAGFAVRLNQIPSGGGPVLRPLRQPLYDSKAIDSSAPMQFLFRSEAYGEYGYYWTGGDGEEVVWKSNWDQAIGFDTREDAESRAFEIATKFPHLIGKLIVMKLKVKFGVSV